MFFNTSVFHVYSLQLSVSQRLNKTPRFLPFSAQNRGMAKSMRVLRASNGRENMKNVYNIKSKDVYIIIVRIYVFYLYNEHRVRD